MGLFVFCEREEKSEARFDGTPGNLQSVPVIDSRLVLTVQNPVNGPPHRVVHRW